MAKEAKYGERELYEDGFAIRIQEYESIWWNYGRASLEQWKNAQFI